MVTFWAESWNQKQHEDLGEECPKDGGSSKCGGLGGALCPWASETETRAGRWGAVTQAGGSGVPGSRRGANSLPSNLLILCCTLLLLPSIFPSIRVFSNESVLCIKWPKYWTFSFSLSPSNEYSGLISLRIDWLDILAVQGLYLLVSFRRILEILWNLCRQLCHFTNKQFCFSFQSIWHFMIEK